MVVKLDVAETQMKPVSSVNFKINKIVEGDTSSLQSLPLGYGCITLWNPSGPIYAFNGTNQKVAEIPRPVGYLYALGRGADETFLVPTISGLVYRFNMDGHLVEMVALDIPMHLLAVTQLPDGRYLACIGDRHFGLDVTPSFVLFDSSGEFEQLVMQRQSYDPEFEVLPWGDVLVSDVSQLITTVMSAEPGLEATGRGG